MACCRCSPGLVSAVVANDAYPGLDDSLHTNSLGRLRRRAPAVPAATVKDRDAGGLQVRA